MWPAPRGHRGSFSLVHQHSIISASAFKPFLPLQDRIPDLPAPKFRRNFGVNLLSPVSPAPKAFGVNLLSPVSCLLSSSPHGFTLLELLAVFVIIVTLAGMILGVTKYAATNAATSRTRAEIAAMEGALESYKNDNGAYPLSTPTRASPPAGTEISNSGSLYAALAGTRTNQYFYFKPSQLKTSSAGITYIVDPFGNPYNYFCTVPPSSMLPNYQVNQATFDLWSYGPSGTNGAPDMITNWKQ